jgi:hypothetical protein
LAVFESGKLCHGVGPFSEHCSLIEDMVLMNTVHKYFLIFFHLFQICFKIKELQWQFWLCVGVLVVGKNRILLRRVLRAFCLKEG